MAGYISLTRDRDPGRVFSDPATGKPRIEYTPSPFDAANTLEGVIALCKICYITGATEIVPFLPNVEPFVRKPADPTTTTTTTTTEDGKLEGSGNDDDNGGDDSGDGGIDPGITDPSFTAWLARVRAAGNPSPYTTFASAHQMGSCRMGSHPGAGVVDPRGRVWEAEGLFVADASVFPSASGVNPMITNMAIADWIARGVGRELEGEKSRA